MSPAERRRRARAPGSPRAKQPRQPAPAIRSAPLPGTREQLRRALGSPDALRQAFLLYEVLGPPVSLRRPTGDSPR